MQSQQQQQLDLGLTTLDNLINDSPAAYKSTLVVASDALKHVVTVINNANNKDFGNVLRALDNTSTAAGTDSPTSTPEQTIFDIALSHARTAVGNTSTAAGFADADAKAALVARFTTLFAGHIVAKVVGIAPDYDEGKPRFVAKYHDARTASVKNYFIRTDDAAAAAVRRYANLASAAAQTVVDRAATAAVDARETTAAIAKTFNATDATAFTFATNAAASANIATTAALMTEVNSASALTELIRAASVARDAARDLDAAVSHTHTLATSDIDTVHRAASAAHTARGLDTVSAARDAARDLDAAARGLDTAAEAVRYLVVAEGLSEKVRKLDKFFKDWEKQKTS
ncbi:hypothetical protein AGMMS49990_09620 [Endomicrobiia bacterium]|nr:hypothetical protein AGMMS49990_09620 [Endomicrobiia bacterium]